MNKKTPAMVLQEFTVKNRYSPPEYNVVMSKTGTHENEFHYEVNVASICARGFGRSKQVAKHNAATKALEILAELGRYDSSANPVEKFEAQSHRNESDDPQTPSVNHIGYLKDFCNENKIPQPEFKELSDVGPPHCREFTYECTVSSIKTQWTANTKKQAKQLAAKEMVEKIRDLYPQLSEQIATENKCLTEQDNEAIERFQSATTWVVPNRGAKVKHFPKSLPYIMKEKSKKIEDFRELLQEKTKDALDTMCNTLDIEYKLDTIQEDPTVMTAVFGIDTPLAFMAMGNDNLDAETNLLQEIFYAFNIFMNIPDDIEF